MTLEAVDVQVDWEKPGNTRSSEENNHRLAKMDATDCRGTCQGIAVISACFCIFAYVVSIHYVFSVFYSELLDEFSSTRSATAWAGSISTGMTFLTSYFAGIFVDAVGERLVVSVGGLISGLGFLAASWSTKLWHLYLCYGLVVGLGHGLSLFSCPIMLSKWFQRRLGVASGLGTSGSGVGTIVLGQVLPLLISEVGWRNTFRIYAAAAVPAVTLPALAAFSPPPGSHGTGQRRKLSLKLGRLFAIPAFPWLVASLFAASFAWEVPHVHLARLLEEQRLPDSGVSLVLTCLGVGGLARVLTMYAADRVGHGTVAIAGMGVLSLADGLLLVGWPVGGQVALGVALGAGIGSVFASITPLATDVTPQEDVPQAIGLLYSVLVVGLVLGPPFVGLLHTQTGSYLAGFAFSSAAWVVAAGLLVPVLWRHRSLLRGQVQKPKGGERPHRVSAETA